MVPRANPLLIKSARNRRASAGLTAPTGRVANSGATYVSYRRRYSASVRAFTVPAKAFSHARANTANGSSRSSAGVTAPVAARSPSTSRNRRSAASRVGRVSWR
jgi:hypothetical protein